MGPSITRGFSNGPLLFHHVTRVHLQLRLRVATKARFVVNQFRLYLPRHGPRKGSVSTQLLLWIDLYVFTCRMPLLTPVQPVQLPRTLPSPLPKPPRRLRPLLPPKQRPPRPHPPRVVEKRKRRGKRQERKRIAAIFTRVCRVSTCRLLVLIQVCSSQASSPRYWYLEQSDGSP